MQTQTRDDLHLRPSSIRRDSFESDAALSSRRPSIITAFPALRPGPIYIASSAASQLATDNQMQRIHEELYDLSKSATTEEEGAIFTDPALSMVNHFLDHLLYCVFLTARSASLASLRVAVEHVLKGRLARIATAAANEELEELSVNGEDEEFTATHDEHDDLMRTHVDLIFRRTRLKVMVYTRLGEMEEEEEETYLQDESLWADDGVADEIAVIADLVSPAATIFLTSILEFIAEQCVELAAQAAFGRAALKRNGRGTPMFGSQTDSSGQRVVIEEHDVERIALNQTLGRLWRTWRKTARTPKSPGLVSPTGISPTSWQLSARTSASTLRPHSALDVYRHNQLVGGESELRNTFPQTNATRPGHRAPEFTIVQPRQNTITSSSEEDPSSTRKRIHISESSPAATTDRYGYPTPATSSHGSHMQQSSDEMSWHDKRGNGRSAGPVEQPRVNGNLPGSAAAKSKSDMDVTVPVSGVLRLHLPTNAVANLSPNKIGETTVARFDFASPKTIAYDDHERTAASTDNVQVSTNGLDMSTSPQDRSLEEDQPNPDESNAEAAERLGRSWNSHVSSQYRAKSANTGMPLRVRVPGIAEYTPAITIEPGASFGSTTSDASEMQGTQPKVVKVVTAKEITPTSEAFPSPITDRHLSKGSFEPLTPHTGITEPSSSPQVSPQVSPRPPAINPPAEANGLSPREPRIQTESTRDFADFIRSTVPTEEQSKVAPIISPTSPTAAKSGISSTSPRTASRNQMSRGHHAGNGAVDAALATSTQLVHPSQRISVDKVDSTEDPFTPVMARVKNPALEPRDPIIRGRSNNDLISFLREGPPGSGSSKPTPRETMERRTAGKITISPTPGRTSDITLTSASKNESVSSHSPLLPQPSMNATRTEQPAYSTQRVGAEASQLQPGPKKSNPAKDPYTLPSDDDDDDVLTALPKKARNEESLIDFLNNTGPTSSESMSTRRSLDERKTIGLGLKDSVGKGLSLRPTSPSSQHSLTSARSPITMSPLVANPISLTPMPHLGEFLSVKTSAESSVKPDGQRYEYAPRDGSNRAKTPTAPRPDSRNENRAQGVRGFFRKIAA